MNKITCPICSYEYTNFIFISKHNRQVYQCLDIRCGHFFTPFPSSEQGICERPVEIVEDAELKFKKFDSRNKLLISDILSLTGLSARKNPITVIDFGSGPAHFARSVSEYDPSIQLFCIEPNSSFENYYNRYKLNHIKNYEEMNSKSVDLIVMIEVIEHLLDPIAVLKGLSKILKNDGVLFITTPLGTKYASLTNAYDTKSHIHFFTKESLDKVLEISNFEPLNYHYIPNIYYNSTIDQNIFLKFIHLIKLKIKFLYNKFIGPRHLIGFTKINK